MEKELKNTIENIKDSLKDEISIIDVAKELSILDKYNIKKTGNTYLGDCPTGHSSENHQCFGLNAQENYYHCFHCNQSGDIISLVQLVLQIGYKQAVLWLAKTFQPELATDIEHLSFERTKEEEESYRKHILFDEIYRYGKKLLYEETGKAALQALIDRGYSESNLKQTDWIYWPMEADIKNLLPGKKLPGLNGAFGDNFRLAFPYKDKHGIITGFVKRSTERAPINGVRYDSTPGLCKHDLFGLNRIHNQDTIIIVEGYPDALYLPTIGLNNVTAIGQGILSETHIDGLRLRKIKRVILALDNDNVGPVNTENALHLLTKHDTEGFVIDPKLYGKYKDPDEFVMAVGIDAFRRLVESPISGARWMANRMLDKHNIKTDAGKKAALTEVFDYAYLVNNPVDSKDIVDVMSSGLNIGIEMLEPYLAEYQEKKAKEQHKSGINTLLRDVNKSLYKDDVKEASELLTVKARELALEYERMRVNPQEAFGTFLRNKKSRDMQRIPGQLLGYDLKRFSRIAQHLSGVQPGYYVIGADPNVGKTAFIINMAVDLLNTNPEAKVFLYSMDDDRNTIINRMLALLTAIEINNVQVKQADLKEQAKLDQAYSYLAGLYDRGRLIVKDIAELNNVDDLEIEIRKIRDKEHLVVFIDGLYNLNVTVETQSIREENMERAMRMKQITKTYNIPLFTTAELRKKQSNEDKNKKRSLHDIMETGKYGYNADVVWMLSPEDYEQYDTQDEPVITLKFEKNKLAAFRGYMELKFKRSRSTFEEMQSKNSFTKQLAGGLTE